MNSPNSTPVATSATDRKWAYLVLSAIVLSMLIRPLDVAWMFDQGLLLGHALMYNRSPAHMDGLNLPFTPGLTGLMGTRGVYYGPLPTWFYQILLAITHNFAAIVRIRTLLVAGTTAFSLAWLARTMRCSAWLAVITMLSPWMWIYSRQIWDNSLCIPLTALTFASYADFLARRGLGSLLLTVGACCACVLTHFLTLSLVAPIMAHMFFTQLRWLWKYKWSIAAVLAVFIFLASPYISFLLNPANATHEIPYWQIAASPINGWFFPLLGAHHLSSAGLGNDLESDWLYSLGNIWFIAGMTAQTITLIAYPLAWFGMILAAIKCRPAICLSPNASTIHHLCLIALLSYVAETVLHGVERIYEFPHYFNGNWIIFVFFAWLAADQIGKRLWNRTIIVRALPTVYAMCLLVSLSAVIWKIARDGGTLGIGFGTTLGNQIEAVQKIAEFSPQNPQPALYVPQWQMFKYALPELYVLVNAPPGHIPAKQVVVKYEGMYPDARLVVEAKP